MSQTKTQLQQVTEFLLAGLTPYVTPNQIDAWQEHGELIISTEALGGGGFRLAKWKHSAVIAFEKFPHKKINPYNLLAMLAAFLHDSGWPRDEFGLDDPTLDIDPNSADSVLVIIELQLMDDVDLIPDASGPVLFMGNRYRVALVPVNVAETVDVQVQPGGDE